MLTGLSLVSFNGLTFHRLAKPVVGGLAAASATYLTRAKCELLEEDAKEKCMWFMRTPHFMEKAHFNPESLKDLHAEGVPLVAELSMRDYLITTSDNPKLSIILKTDLIGMYNCLFQESPVFKKRWDRPETATMSPALSAAYQSALVDELVKTNRIATAEELAIVRTLAKQDKDSVSEQELEMIKKRTGWMARLSSKIK